MSEVFDPYLGALAVVLCAIVARCIGVAACRLFRLRVRPVLRRIVQ